MGLLLIPTSITLNDLEHCNNPYFAFFTEFDCLAGQLFIYDELVREYTVSQ